LALQAYNMQYAWSESSQEGAIAATLLRDIKVKLASGNAQDLSTDAGFWSLALVSATLRPLSDIEGSENFLSTDIAGLPAFVSAVVRQQVAEPLMESEMEAAVEAVTAIEDATSLEVQAQNENRPSPRWFSIAPKQAGTLGDTLRAQAPWSRPPVFAEGEINAFVAGCGTGKHAIDVATQYPMSNVTGLDLSRTSLAYAWRMALELQLTNVRFVQGDIAALQGHAERYHLIECVGVLHSMADPVAGWRNLVGLLEPHGIMKIGLYSAAARADVTAAREVIAEAGVAKKAQQDDIFGADSIRRARQVILNLEPGHPARGVIAKRDFFSLSGCRDMLFPAREQTYSIPAIAADLGQLGLDFLGFHISDPAIVERYLEMHPEAEDLADLGNWQKVEEAHADTFAGMYQFWCQKRD
jgi:SAM-dependent methyltransferase